MLLSHSEMRPVRLNDRRSQPGGHEEFLIESLLSWDGWDTLLLQRVLTL